jgi:hypothetical protein
MNAIWGAQNRFVPASNARRMRLDGRSLLFCEQSQQLFELNPAADVIWSALLEESPPRAARRVSAELGIDSTEAAGHVERQLAQWLRHGYWRPAELPPPGSGTALRLAVDAVRAEIRCGDETLLARLKQVFGQFPTFAAAPTVSIGVTPWPEGFHLFEGDRYAGGCAGCEVVPRIKALLTERVVSRRFDGFFAHGALLEKGSVLAMLSGAPGAGKSTLAFALQSAGWSLLADDLIRVDRDAGFRGTPFAPAIKQGAWPLLQAFSPDVMHWPVELRSDGQQVRYAPAAPTKQRPRTPDLFIALAREEAACAGALPLDPLDALSALLGEAFSARGRISADLMARLAERFQNVACRRLVYSALPEAIETVEALAREL